MTLLWLLMFSLQGEGQPDTPDIKVDFTETVTVVNLPLRVRKDGTFYKNLNVGELRIMENGVRVRGKDLAPVESPLVMHFLFDLSTSNSRNIYLSKKTARDMVEKMRTGDLAKVSFFSSSYQPLTEYSSNRNDLKKSLSFLTPVGSTALYDAIGSALGELGKMSGLRVLLLFSDGHDLMSRTTEIELMTLAKNYRIPLVFVEFGEGTTADKPLLMAQTQFMAELASASGGHVFRALGPNSRPLLKSMKKYRQRYLLRFTPPGPEDVEQWRSLVIDIPNCPDCQLEYRHAYSIETMSH